MTSLQSSPPAPQGTLQGLTALVTGASSGIGRAIALGLARQGAGLCLVGRDRGRLEGAANEAGAPALFYQVDLAEEGAIERLARDVARGPGGVDVLVLAHGLFASGTSESVPVSELDALYRTNVRAAYLLAQSFLASLAERQGQIVFVNSSVVAGARGGVGQYAASKLALKGLADSLRDEVNPRGIRVLSVYPGRTATPMQAAIFEAEGRTWEPERLLQPEDVAQIVIAALLLPRTAEVTEIYVRPMNKV